MKEISESIFKEILQGSFENLNLEFKSTFDFDKNTWARERLIRSILAMSNTRDGGYIVVGIEEKNDKGFSLSGIGTFESLFKTKEEELKSIVESFSSSTVRYEAGLGEYQNSKLILISVTEFFLNPSICRKNGKHESKILEEGAIYIRTLKDRPSSIKLTNPVDIQDFLERSVDKQIMNLHRRGWKHDTEKSRDSKSFFERERADF